MKEKQARKVYKKDGSLAPIDIKFFLKKHGVSLDANVVAAMKEIAEDVVDMCALNADAKGIDYGGGIEDVEVDKQSILEIKKLVKK